MERQKARWRKSEDGPNISHHLHGQIEIATQKLPYKNCSCRRGFKPWPVYNIYCKLYKNTQLFNADVYLFACL